MCHVTRYCNVIGLAQYTVQQHMACIPGPSLFVEIGLACETAPTHAGTVNGPFHAKLLTAQDAFWSVQELK